MGDLLVLFLVAVAAALGLFILVQKPPAEVSPDNPCVAEPCIPDEPPPSEDHKKGRTIPDPQPDHGRDPGPNRGAKD